MNDILTVIFVGVSAVSTAVVALFTFRLSVATSGQLCQLIESIKLAREDFVATHRPKIRVRGLILKPGTAITQPRVEIVNVGESAAFIAESHCQVVCAADETEAIGKFDDSTPNNPVPQREIKCGASIGMDAIPFSTDLQRAKLEYEGGGGYTHLFAIGWIRYRDNNETLRRTGFCRRHEPNTGLFRTYADVASDFEYED